MKKQTKNSLLAETKLIEDCNATSNKRLKKLGKLSKIDSFTNKDRKELNELIKAKRIKCDELDTWLGNWQKPELKSPAK